MKIKNWKSFNENSDHMERPDNDDIFKVFSFIEKKLYNISWINYDGNYRIENGVYKFKYSYTHGSSLSWSEEYPKTTFGMAKTKLNEIITEANEKFNNVKVSFDENFEDVFGGNVDIYLFDLDYKLI